jgi:hypothetical protein
VLVLKRQTSAEVDGGLGAMYGSKKGGAGQSVTVELLMRAFEDGFKQSYKHEYMPHMVRLED